MRKGQGIANMNSFRVKLSRGSGQDKTPTDD